MGRLLGQLHSGLGRRAGPGDLEAEARSTERLDRAGLGAAVVLEAEEAYARWHRGQQGGGLRTVDRGTWGGGRRFGGGVGLQGVGSGRRKPIADDGGASWCSCRAPVTRQHGGPRIGEAWELRDERDAGMDAGGRVRPSPGWPGANGGEGAAANHGGGRREARPWLRAPWFLALLLAGGSWWRKAHGRSGGGLDPGGSGVWCPSGCCARAARVARRGCGRWREGSSWGLGWLGWIGPVGKARWRGGWLAVDPEEEED